MSGATIALFQAMLREQLEPTIQDEVEWQDVLLGDIMNTPGMNKIGVKRNMENNLFEIVSKTDGMTAYAGAEGASLINSDLALARMSVAPKFVRARSLLGHEAIQATLSSQASLEEGVTLYGTEIRNAMNRAAGRFVRGDGTGIVGCLAAGVVSSATHTVKAKAAGTVASQAHYYLGTQYFMAGQELTIGTAAQFLAGTATDAIIDTVNSDTSITFTASKALGSASGANNLGGDNTDTYYVRFKGDYGNSPMGLLGLIDDGTIYPDITTIQGKTRSTTPYMKSYTLDKATAATIVADFRTLYINVTRYNKTGMKFFVVSDDVYAKYTDSITIVNQSTPTNAQYKDKMGTGHTGLMFSYGSTPIPILYDSLLPYGTVRLVDTDQLFRADLFADDFVEGGILARVSGSTNYETIRAAYYNYGTFSARRLGGAIHYQAV